MPYAWTAMLLAICVSIVASRDDVNGQAARELSSMRPTQRKPPAEIPTRHTASAKRLNPAASAG